MKAFATNKNRTTRSVRIEAAIEILIQVLGSRNDIIRAIAELIVLDSELTEKQRHQVFEEIQKMYGDQENEKETREPGKIGSVNDAVREDGTILKTRFVEIVKRNYMDRKKLRG
jgi:hypothetical protein